MNRFSFVLIAIVQLAFLPRSSPVPLVSVSEASFDKGQNFASDVLVDVQVYYEALCPSSREFVGQLSKVIPTVSPIVSLSLYPYGNAHPSNVSQTCGDCNTCNVWECNVTCQHGIQECKLNLAQACLLSYVPTMEALPAINCIENSPFSFHWCIARHAPDGVVLVEKVMKCMASPLGKDVQEQMAAATFSLNPPKKFVPWVVVEKSPLDDDYKNIVSAVCNAYKIRGGVSPPSACVSQYAQAPESGALESQRVFPHIDGPSNRTILYTRCKIVKILGEVCMYVYEDPSNKTATDPTLGLILAFSGPGGKSGLQFDIPFPKGEACISDKQLLLLLLLIPELQPYEKEIRRIIEIRGFIPADVLSECVRVYNATGTGTNFSACVELDSRVMCVKDKCLYKGSDPFGCFHRGALPLTVYT